MGVTLPPELAGLLNELGYPWPQIDEIPLARVGDLWSLFGERAGAHTTDAHQDASAVWARNSGDDITAFQTAWTHEKAPPAVLGDGTTGAHVLGAGLNVGALVVLGLKIYIIVQLSILFVQIVLAAFSGAGALAIPVYKKITDLVLNALFNRSTEALLA